MKPCLAAAAVLAFLAGPILSADDAAARFILVNQVLVSDDGPDRRFHTGPALTTQFQSAVSQEFPGRVIQLGPDRLLSPDEPAVILLPRITAARVSQEVAAGSIHRFAASIVGDVSALDPWTGSALFSATRMVSAEVVLGQSKLEAADEDLDHAFGAAYGQWTAACLSELHARLAPFVLRAGTLALPDGARNFPGGAWPFGLERGVKAGLFLAGEAGHGARVAAVFNGYSAIEDAADTSRAIPAGETFSVTQVRQPTERPEPRVALAWIGPAPSSPENLPVKPLTVDAFTDLLGDYLGKSSSVRILPAEVHDPGVKDKLFELTADVSRFTQAARKGLMTWQRETFLQSAQQNPEYRIALFVTGAYAGTVPHADFTERRYRVGLAAAVFERRGGDSAPVYALSRLFTKDEHLDRVTRQGVRDIDPAADWFTVTRNGVIELSRAVLDSGILRRTSESSVLDAEIGADRAPHWPVGRQPDSFSPLTWTRPSGTVDPVPGVPVVYYRVLQPTQGFLNKSVLAKENVRPGDHVRYNYSGPEPSVIGLRFEIPSETPGEAQSSWLAPAALECLVAGRLATDLQSQILIVHENQPNPLPEGAPLLRVHVSALSEQPKDAALSFSGQWRVHLLASPSPEPKAKLGILATASAPAGQSGESPEDRNLLRMEYFSKALDQLTAAIRSEGLEQALGKMKPL